MVLRYRGVNFLSLSEKHTFSDKHIYIYSYTSLCVPFATVGKVLP